MVIEGGLLMLVLARLWWRSLVMCRLPLLKVRICEEGETLFLSYLMKGLVYDAVIEYSMSDKRFSLRFS